MKIESLSNNMFLADRVAQWVYDEFIKNVKPGLSYEDVLTTVQNCHESIFPIRLVAIVDKTCAGTVSLVHNDLRCRTYTPWLAALYVDKPFRNRKIGERLIDHVKDVVKNMGYPELYLRTQNAGDYYRRLGWRFVESCDDDFGLRPDVFKISLG